MSNGCEYSERCTFTLSTTNPVSLAANTTFWAVAVILTGADVAKCDVGMKRMGVRRNVSCDVKEGRQVPVTPDMQPLRRKLLLFTLLYRTAQHN